MKSIALCALLCILAMPSIAAQNATDESTTTSAAEAGGEAAITDSLEPFPSKEARLSYAVGMVVASQLEQLDVSLSREHFLDALTTVLSGGEPVLSEQEAQEAYQRFALMMQEKQQAQQPKMQSKEEMTMVVTGEGSGAPEDMVDSVLLPGLDMSDEVIEENAKNYDFTVRTFFETIEWGMQGAVQNATWSKVDDTTWEVATRTVFNNQVHEETITLRHLPESNTTLIEGYSSPQGPRPKEDILEVYKNIFDLFRKH